VVNKVMKFICKHFGHKWTRRIGKDGRWERYCSICGVNYGDKNK